MPKVEGTFKPPGLRVTGTKHKGTQTLPSQSNPQFYTHRSVSKPLHLLWTVRSSTKIETLQIGSLTHFSHIEDPALKDKE